VALTRDYPGCRTPIPYLSEEDCELVNNLEFHDYGAGVTVFKNVIDVDQPRLFEYIDKYAIHSTPGVFLKEENGETWCEDLAGKRHPVSTYYRNPYRLGGFGNSKPVMRETPEDIAEFFYENENQIYLCLMKYIDIYTHVLNSLWWRFRGNVLKYYPNGAIGMHSDNDTSRKTIDGQRYETDRPEAIFQVLSTITYYNDCVDTEEELDGTNFTGGEMWFPFLNNLTYKPRTGDILFFPANYIGSHGVNTIKAGIRYNYQSVFGQGVHNNEPSPLVPIYEADNGHWCQATYLPWLHQDWQRFSESPYSRWATLDGSPPNGEINPLVRPVESEPEGPYMPYEYL